MVDSKDQAASGSPAAPAPTASTSRRATAERSNGGSTAATAATDSATGFSADELTRLMQQPAKEQYVDVELDEGSLQSPGGQRPLPPLPAAHTSNTGGSISVAAAGSAAATAEPAAVAAGAGFKKPSPKAHALSGSLSDGHGRSDSDDSKEVDPNELEIGLDDEGGYDDDQGLDGQNADGSNASGANGAGGSSLPQLPTVRLFNLPLAATASNSSAASSPASHASPGSAAAASPAGAAAATAPHLLSIRTNTMGRYLDADVDSPSSEASRAGRGAAAHSGASATDSDASLTSGGPSSDSRANSNSSNGSHSSTGEPALAAPAAAAAAGGGDMMRTLRGPQRVSMATLRAMALAAESAAHKTTQASSTEQTNDGTPAPSAAPTHTDTHPTGFKPTTSVPLKSEPLVSGTAGAVSPSDMEALSATHPPATGVSAAGSALPLRATMSLPLEVNLPPSPFAVSLGQQRGSGSGGGEKPHGGSGGSAGRRHRLGQTSKSAGHPLRQSADAAVGAADSAAGSSGLANVSALGLLSPFVSAQTAAIAARSEKSAAAAAAVTAAAAATAEGQPVPAWLAIPSTNHTARSSPTKHKTGPRSPVKKPHAAQHAPQPAAATGAADDALDALDDFLKDRAIIKPRYPTAPGAAAAHAAEKSGEGVGDAAGSEESAVTRTNTLTLIYPRDKDHETSTHAHNTDSAHSGPHGIAPHPRPGHTASHSKAPVSFFDQPDGDDNEQRIEHAETEEDSYEDDLEHEDDEAGDDDEYDEYEDDEEEAEEVSDDDENEFGLPNFNRRGQPPPTNQEVETLKEELNAQKAVAAGLRGELRKYTALTATLEQQLTGYRHTHTATASGAAAAAAAHAAAAAAKAASDGSTAAAGAAAAAADSSGSTLRSVPSISTTTLNLHIASVRASVAAATSPPPADTDADSGSSTQPAKAAAAAEAAAPVSPTAAPAAGLDTALPPQPVDTGLEAGKRLALYREALSGSIFVASGALREELLAAEEVLKGKDHLDSGIEKVLLIKLQKIISAGAGATRHLEMMQQDSHRRGGASPMTAPADPGRELGLPPSHFDMPRATSPGLASPGADAPSAAATAAASATDAQLAEASALAQQWLEQVTQLQEENERLARDVAALRAQLAPMPTSPFASPPASRATSALPTSPFVAAYAGASSAAPASARVASAPALPVPQALRAGNASPAGGGDAPAARSASPLSFSAPSAKSASVAEITAAARTLRDSRSAVHSLAPIDTTGNYYSCTESPSPSSVLEDGTMSERLVATEPSDADSASKEANRIAGCQTEPVHNARGKTGAAHSPMRRGGAPAGPRDADAAGWSFERQILLKRIGDLEKQISTATPVGENQQPPQSQEVPDAATDTATQTDISPAHVDASASGDVAAQSSAQADSTQAQAQHAAAQQEAAQVVAATRAEEASSLRQKLEDTLSQVSTLEAQLSQVTSRRVALSSEVVRLENLLLSQKTAMSDALQWQSKCLALEQQLATASVHTQTQAEQLLASQQQLRAARAALAEKDAAALPPAASTTTALSALTDLLLWRNRQNRTSQQTPLQQQQQLDATRSASAAENSNAAAAGAGAHARPVSSTGDSAAPVPTTPPPMLSSPPDAAGALAGLNGPQTSSTKATDALRLRLATLLQLASATDAKLKQPRKNVSSETRPSPTGSAMAALLDEDVFMLPLDVLVKRLEKRVRGVLLAALEARQAHAQAQAQQQQIHANLTTGLSLGQGVGVGGVNGDVSGPVAADVATTPTVASGGARDVHNALAGLAAENARLRQRLLDQTVAATQLALGSGGGAAATTAGAASGGGAPGLVKRQESGQLASAVAAQLRALAADAAPAAVGTAAGGGANGPQAVSL